MHLKRAGIYLAVAVLLLAFDDAPVAHSWASSGETFPTVASSQSLPIPAPLPVVSQTPPTPSPVPVDSSTMSPTPVPTPKPTPIPNRMADLVYSTSGGTWWTFDDCERPYLPGTVTAIVGVLQKYGVKKVTFFMNGDCYQSRPDLVNTIREAGFEIGNHAYQHIKLSNLGVASRIADAIAGGPPGSRVFRPPFWDVSPIVRLAAYQAGYEQIIMASIDAGDSSEANLCPRILSGIAHPGPTSIVALYMTNRETPKALEAYFSGNGCQ